jgi:hypothetical protein
MQRFLERRALRGRRAMHLDQLRVLVADQEFELPGAQARVVGRR